MILWLILDKKDCPIVIGRAQEENITVKYRVNNKNNNNLTYGPLISTYAIDQQMTICYTVQYIFDPIQTSLCISV